MAERLSMLDQYRRIKARYRDVILFFRLGDFYEMFAEDATVASSILDLTLTKRQNTPMCGIPYHAAKPYISRLLKAGKKVAICEQLSEPGSRKLVERDVVEVVTPGTTTEEEFIDGRGNNYISSLCSVSGRLCIAALDVSTGEFWAFSEEESEEDDEFILAELHRMQPRELIVQQSLYDRPSFRTSLREFDEMLVERRPDWSFDTARGFEQLSGKFGVVSLKGFGFSDDAPELAAAGVLLEYVLENSKSSVPHICRIARYERNEYLGLDEATRKNLELVRNLSDAGKRDTLLSVLDRTQTVGGFRQLRQWILSPLRNRGRIEERLDAVGYLYHDQLMLNELRRTLAGVRDTERLIARLSMDKAHAKDLLALRDSLTSSLEAEKLLGDVGVPALLSSEALNDVMGVCSEAASWIRKTVRDDPSILLTEGNLIRDGVDPELDQLRAMKKDSSGVLAAYLEEERESSGISNLRIRYNKIIGYYLEVTKGKLDAVPEHFIRRQSLVTGERYSTERLAELESEINGATEKIVELERRLFLELRESLKRHIPSMSSLAASIARADCVSSLAYAATAGGYTRPSILDEPRMDIRQARHPVVETCLPSGAFVPNDIALGTPGPSFALITGPNMAGKSTMLRQTALIALMAQMGSFVPAESAEVGLVDKIFCRVGAMDNLARGESTFLVEMHETAYILNTATAKSLVIMDEVGRGTGTLDGVSIAWAVSEYLLNHVGCRTLFATHYHELTSMEHGGMRNLSMAVLENEGEIVFLKRLKEGPAAGSYGIHVARLAGIPSAVLERARELQGRLGTLERSLSSQAGPAAAAGRAEAAPEPSAAAGPEAKEPSGELFSAEDLALAKLKGVDSNRMTPLEALELVDSLGKLLDGGSRPKRRRS